MSNIQLPTINCPFCGAATSDLENCEFCDSSLKGHVPDILLKISKERKQQIADEIEQAKQEEAEQQKKEEAEQQRKAEAADAASKRIEELKIEMQREDEQRKKTGIIVFIIVLAFIALMIFVTLKPRQAEPIQQQAEMVAVELFCDVDFPAEYAWILGEWAMRNDFGEEDILVFKADKSFTWSGMGIRREGNYSFSNNTVQIKGKQWESGLVFDFDYWIEIHNNSLLGFRKLMPANERGLLTEQEYESFRQQQMQDDVIGVYVVVIERVFFHNEPDERTVRRGFLIEGDEVPVIRFQNGFGYAIFTNSRGQTSEGWLKMSGLELFFEEPNCPW